MITTTEVNKLWMYFIAYFKANGRLSLEQERHLKNLKIELAPLDYGAAGFYSLKDDKMVVNTNYKDKFILYETVFHELDHARCSYINRNGERLTGLWTDDNSGSYNEETGDIISARKGEFLSEGITAINGENCYHSYIRNEFKNNEPWKEIPSTTDKNLFPGHVFPSGLWWYKLNGNFISQFSAVMGITENQFCALADNGKGRENISKLYNQMTSTDNAKFENVEEKLDYVGTAANIWLHGVNLSLNTMDTCQKNIKDAQIMLFSHLSLAYNEGKISKTEYVNRFNKFNRYTTMKNLGNLFADGALQIIKSKEHSRQ